MTDIHIMLSDPEALARFRSLVETTRLMEGELTAEVRMLLEQRAAELGVHRLDAEQIHVETHALPSVQAATTLYTARRRQAQHDHEEIIAERVANRQFRAALTEQLQTEREQRQTQLSLIEELRRQLAALEQELHSLRTAPPPAQEAVPAAQPPAASSAAAVAANAGAVHTEPVSNASAANSPVVVLSEPPGVAVAQAVASAPAPEPPVLPDGAELILIPAGQFLMGHDDGTDKQQANERPIHFVHLDAYYIHKTPVTVRQYLRYCAATGRPLPPAPSFNANWRQQDHPIVNVNWEEATTYCEWLSGETGMRVALPTEAQWEKAARGTEGRLYPWGDAWDRDRCANKVGNNSLSSAMPVESYPSGASPYGVLDMAGNVLEWCSDWLDENYYAVSPARNPTGPETGQFRVLRGGGWAHSDASLFRCAYRYRSTPTNGNTVIGFRCVVSADSR